MAGSPLKRQRREQQAMKELQAKAQAENREEAEKLPRSRYTPELAEKACELIVSGLAIEDSVIGDVVVAQGVASRLKIAPSSFYKWQQERADFADSITRARKESAHRIADKIQSLADVALKEPAMATACRVAADILKWSAMVRNPKEYGEKVEHTVRQESYVDFLARISKLEQEQKDSGANAGTAADAASVH